MTPDSAALTVVKTGRVNEYNRCEYELRVGDVPIRSTWVGDDEDLSSVTRRLLRWALIP